MKELFPTFGYPALTETRKHTQHTKDRLSLDISPLSERVRMHHDAKRLLHILLSVVVASYLSIYLSADLSSSRNTFLGRSRAFSFRLSLPSFLAFCRFVSILCRNEPYDFLLTNSIKQRTKARAKEKGIPNHTPTRHRREGKDSVDNPTIRSLNACNPFTKLKRTE